MTKEKLLSLIASWQRGDCPGEILNDAILDFGIDTSGYFKGIWVISFHLLPGSGKSLLDNCSRNNYTRSGCSAINSLVEWLQTLP